MMALTAVGTIQQVNATKAAAQAEERQADQNAKVAEAQAQNATMAGLVEEDRRRAQTRAMLARQRVSIAANNLDMSTGTPLELLGDTASIGEQDALAIRANAAREAWGYRTQAVNARNQGAMTVANAKAQNKGTILTGLGSLAKQGYGLSGSFGGGQAANMGYIGGKSLGTGPA